jgi:hypothetical protein
MIFKAVLATLILMPLVAVGQGNDDVGPKKVAKDDDLSRKVKRFNLHEHLMSPTKKDLQVGVENSRRLARNAIRLGVGTDAHRALVAGGNDFEFLVTQFDLDTPLPSTGPRVVVDTVLDPLPFGDGPGVFPGLPTGTKEYWEDGGNPSKMWEVVACPVAVSSADSAINGQCHCPAPCFATNSRCSSFLTSTGCGVFPCESSQMCIWQ